ncbi:hypothetical protein F2Q69_00042640 [Brassica cretica]|uniref:Uncharacterized protein n=1 Tax=Brassica cretica TaxID=69181 RepID=A0A8S9NC04_BRACR|nr:hypothetical protein F2Q69_00042640 [Brassica cretica]
MRIQKRTQRRTLFRPDRSLRSEWRVGLSSVATVCVLGRYCVRARSLRSDRAVCVLGRYIATKLLAKSSSKVFDFLKNCGVCIGVGHRRSGGWSFLTNVVANCDFLFRIFRHYFDQAFCGYGLE